MTDVSVLVPYRADGGARDRAWAWVRAWWAQQHPGWQVVEGESGDGPFSRAQAIVDAAGRADGDVLVVADADVFCDGVDAAVGQVDTVGWAVPHLLLHRLSAASTDAVLAGADWRGLPLSDDNRQDQRPYKGRETGTLVVLARSVLDDVPPDRRFVGWGREDSSWALALRTLIGAPWRGDADLVHLWHPPADRPSRMHGSAASERLYRRYQAAAKRPARMRAARMRALLDEMFVEV